MIRGMLWGPVVLVLLPGVAAGDTDLIRLDTANAARGWDAVGRLDLGTRGFCTATLIAPDLVLTAAHCLFDKETGARVALGDLHFSLGLRNGRAEAYRGVIATAAHPDYIYAGVEDLDRVGFDVALLNLDQPVRMPSVAPFDTAPAPKPGDQVGVVSYAQDRSEVPSLQKNCEVIDEAPSITVLTCSVDFGASGSPVFDLSGATPHVVSVISAKAMLKDKPVSLAVAVDQVLPILRSELAAQTGASHQPEGVRVLSGGQARAGEGGAKFVSPQAAPP